MASNFYFSRAVKLDNLNAKAETLMKDMKLQDFTTAKHMADAKCSEIKTDLLKIQRKMEEEGELKMTCMERLNLTREIHVLLEERNKSCDEILASCTKKGELMKEYIAMQSGMEILIEEMLKEETAEIPEKDMQRINEIVSTTQKIFQKSRLDRDSKSQLELKEYQEKLQQKGL